MADSLAKLTTFDAYAKTLDDFKIKTNTGALISISSVFIAVLLVISEFIEYSRPSMRPELVVDQARQDRLPIYVNLTFPRMPFLTFDVMDVSGEQQNNIDHDIIKTRLDAMGQPVYAIKEGLPKKQNDVMDPNYCGDCYGAPTKPASGCCNTCQDVINSYAASRWSARNLGDFVQCVREGRVEKLDFSSKEGCQIHAKFMVNKVSGNFHVAPGHSFEHSSMHVHDIQQFAGHLDDLHFEHIVDKLAFGEEFQGQVNPLDGFQKTDVGDAVFFQYFIKVVPTQVNYLNGSTLLTNQYSVTQHQKSKGGQTVPGMFFNYDIAPMRVIYTEYQKPFSSFLTDVCAILGGVFTVAGFLDAFLFSAERALKKKADLGKLN